jgi:hypothetical protein
VVESNDSHIVWKFTGTTGDWAFVFADGRIIVASAVDFDLAAKDTLYGELNDAMDMLNVVSQGITAEARNNALESAIYYASEPEIYHKIKYEFNSNFDFKLIVPDCTVEKARLSVWGNDGSSCNNDNGQTYAIDGKEVVGCWTQYCSDSCGVSTTEITDKIPTGLHSISSGRINSGHTLAIEIITSPLPPKKFVLYGPDFQPWINETGRSMTLDDLNSSITGVLTQPAITAIGTINTTNTSNFA